MSALKFVYRSEPHIAKDGERQIIVYRREMLSDSAEAIWLGPVERALVPKGKKTSPTWQRTGGLLGRACQLPRNRFQNCGYSEKSPKEIRE